jgi:ribosomal protein S18 acetylase RimI-like enzyme
MGAEPVSDNAASWCDAGGLTAVEIAEAASWIYSMDVNFYKLFSHDRLLLQNCIQQLCLEVGSEFFPSRFFRKRGVLVGFVTIFPGSEVFARRIHVLKALMALSSDHALIKKKLQDFAAARGTVEPDSLYLSKIYVAPGSRGTGISQVLLQEFISAAITAGTRMTLHVERTNLKAIAIYERSEFAVSAQNTNGNYLFMCRGLKKAGSDAIS